MQIVLPETGKAGPAATRSPVFLAIDKTGEVFLDDKPIELDALGDAVKKLQADNARCR